MYANISGVVSKDIGDVWVQYIQNGVFNGLTIATSDDRSIIECQMYADGASYALVLVDGEVLMVEWISGRRVMFDKQLMRSRNVFGPLQIDLILA